MSSFPVRSAVFLAAGLWFGPASAADIDAAARDACSCLEAPYAKLEALRPQIQAAMQARDASALTTLQPEMMGSMQGVQGCFNKLEKKYPEIAKDKALQDEATKKMNAICPRPDLGIPGMMPRGN